MPSGAIEFENVRFPILVINLDRRQDRMSRIERSVDTDIFNLTRVQAIDAQSTNFKRLSGFLSGPEEACWKSHQSAMNLQVHEGLKFALILEDDADFENRKFDSMLLRRICEHMSEMGIHVFQLGYLHNQYKWWRLGPLIENLKSLIFKKQMAFKISNNRKLYVVRDSFRSGAHAYLISLEAAALLSKVNQPPAFTTDDFLGLVARSSRAGLEVYRSRQSLIDQWARKTLKVSDLDSDIADKPEGAS
jgi:GR25 family glycosyltransferase involved in LPS biosynthesis